jgi:short-subunit dehydrogenase
MTKQVVLITGASTGIGKETAKLLIEKGYVVYGAARRIEKMQDLKSLGAKILQMDVSDDNSMIQGLDIIIKAEGHIDVLINNAGFGSYGAVEDVPMSDAKYQMEVNVFGLARLTQLVLPHMREQKFGKIVNISSIGGKVTTPLGGWYHASKFAVEALSDCLRLEVNPFGIDIIVIEPGGIKSEWASIAGDHLIKISANTAYKELAKKTSEALKKMELKNSDPSVISKLILKAITVKNPKTRYHAGYMAGPVLFLRKLLPDKLFYKMLMSQLK